MITSTPIPPDGNQNRTGEILGVSIGFLVISFIVVVLRLYTRLFLIKSARWDDWTILLALLGSIVGAGLVFPETHYGFGRHFHYLADDHAVQEYMKYTFGEWIQTFFTLMATKVSICLLLLRISPTRRIDRPIQGLVAFLILTNIVLSLVWIFQCTPVDAAWIYPEEPEKCFTKGQIQRIIISQAIISIISDFILAGFPIIILRNVRIPFRHKILLCGLMGLGILTAACCIVRTVMNWQNDHLDPTWVSVDNFVWRTVEVNIGIIAASLPTLLPLYRLLRDKIIAVRASYASITGRFPWLVSGQSREANVASQSPRRETLGEKEMAGTRTSQWARSTHRAITRVGKAGDEDVEMQAEFAESR